MVGGLPGRLANSSAAFAFLYMAEFNLKLDHNESFCQSNLELHANVFVLLMESY